MFGKREKSPGADLVDVAEMIFQPILMQFMLAGYEDPPYPSDDYVVGYIYGFCDAFHQRSTIEASEKAALVRGVYLMIYGADDGPDLMEKSQTNSSDDITDGIMRGGQDVFKWLDSSDASRETLPPVGI